MRHILLAAMMAILPFLASGQSCPRACRCDRRKKVYCNEKELILIPYGIPEDTDTLLLQGNSVANGPITDEVLSSLHSLTRLELYQNELTSVPRGLPTSLETVSFRNNRIKYVGRDAFKGMSSLQALHLDENNITNQGLSQFAFQDTQSLEVLFLSNNLLTEFPEDLPASLQVLRLDNNKINVISRRSMERLSNLINLDLSNNAIAQRRIEPLSMNALVSLQTLDMSSNRLSELPTGLPRTVRELMLSSNQIQYVYVSENEEHGSLRRLTSLSRVDLSSNMLKSVEPSAFSYLSLHSAELQGNPWQCDCDLAYFKQWLTSSGSTLSSESNIRCSSPSAFSGVTLNSIDAEALTCDSRTNTREMMTTTSVSAHGFRMLWRSSEETPDPPFLKRSLMFGPMKCRNCSIENPASQPLASEARAYMENYSLQDVTSEIRADPDNASIVVERLQPDTHYAVCVLDSEQDPSSITTVQCMDVWTLAVAVTSTPHQDDPALIPLWLIVLCCVIPLLLIIAFVAMMIWKRRSSLKSKTPRMYSNRNDLYYPDAYLPGFTRSLGYRAAPPLQPGLYGTHLTDRTYAECGPGTGQRSTIRDSAIDARMEFDVLLKPADCTSPKTVYAETSSCSECQEGNTLSTSQTGRCSSHDQASGSPPPTYDSLHSYTPMGQRSSIANGTIPTRPGHEPGSYV